MIYTGLQSGDRREQHRPPGFFPVVGRFGFSAGLNEWLMKIDPEIPGVLSYVWWVAGKSV
jgi:hypothetical protein